MLPIAAPMETTPAVRGKCSVYQSMFVILVLLKAWRTCDDSVMSKYSHFLLRKMVPEC